jgi:hypothetical protein
MLLVGAELPKIRRSDEALYALALYIQSLKPPVNPNPCYRGFEVRREDRAEAAHLE